jgi:hypothetical protein
MGKQLKCDRCGGPLGVYRMSWFNRDEICRNCMVEEESHPDIQKAIDADTKACSHGDYNFEGIGWPGKDGRVS